MADTPIVRPRQIIERALGGPSADAMAAADRVLLALDAGGWWFSRFETPNVFVGYEAKSEIAEQEK